MSQTIKDVGFERTAAVCSDSTAVTMKARKDIFGERPIIEDLRDVCHFIHGVVRKISALPEFVKVSLLLVNCTIRMALIGVHCLSQSP